MSFFCGGDAPFPTFTTDDESVAGEGEGTVDILEQLGLTGVHDDDECFGDA